MGEPLIPDAAVKAIQDSQVTAVIAVDDVNYTSRQVYIPPAEPNVDTLEIHTLSGLVTYFQNDVDDLKSPLYVHVKGPTHVDVLAPPEGRHQERAHPVCVEAYPAKLTLGSYLTLEDAIIQLQTAFVQTEPLQALLKVLGNVTDEKVGKWTDDGITQSVTVKQGISLSANVAVPNPISLQPYRTFIEVAQPSSVFVVRIKENSDKMPYVAIIQADGGAWQNEAIANIAEFLRDRLDGKAVVIA